MDQPKPRNWRVIVGTVAGVTALVVVTGLAVFAAAPRVLPAANSNIANEVTDTPSPTETPTEIPTETPAEAPPTATPAPPTPVPITLTYFSMGTSASASGGVFQVTSPTQTFNKSDHFCFLAKFSEDVDASKVSFRITNEFGDTVRSGGLGGSGLQDGYAFIPGLTLSSIINPAIAGSYSLKVIYNGSVKGSKGFTYTGL
jgi:hypothetical protein